MRIHYWLPNMLLFVLFIFSCNTIVKDKERKYHIIIERTSKSFLTKGEREDKVDSVLATSDENAYDSCMGILWGMRYADSVVKGILKMQLEKQGRMAEYTLRKQEYEWNIVGYKIINDSGLDIQSKISDSIKRIVQAKWNR